MFLNDSAVNAIQTACLMYKTSIEISFIHSKKMWRIKVMTKIFLNNDFAIVSAKALDFLVKANELTTT